MNRRTYLTLLLLAALFLGNTALYAAASQKSNVVCFVRFADETDEEMFDQHDFAHYQTLFNGSEAGANTVYNYFRQASYGQLQWTSVFFPQQSGTQIVSYKATHARGYYEDKSSINPNGYDAEDPTAMAARERALVKEIIAYLNETVPADAVIDADSDGLVDNLTIILSGPSAISARHLLWPKRTDLVSASGEFQIAGKRVVGYILTFDRSNGFDMMRNIPINTGVLCHEMSHSLGTYDLYHVSDKLNPVGVWDLMSDNQETAQNMTVYTKWRYCKWVDEIPEISKAGTYTLNPVSHPTADHIAYKIKPIGSEEYFVLEYRKKEGFDQNLPGEGLLVYRINPKFSGGNVGYNGTTRLDEQYIFRPGGTTTADGDLSKAVFSQESGRTAFGGLAAEKPFYSDGTEASFAIANVSACGETLTFDLLDMGPQIVLSAESLTLNGQEHATAILKVSSNTDWILHFESNWLGGLPETQEGNTLTMTIVAESANTTGAPRQATLRFVSQTDPNVVKTLVVTQEPYKSNVILFDDFENTSNPNGWVIEYEGEAGRGWQFTEGSTTGRTISMTNSGTHAMTMKDVYWEDVHMDAKLTSPLFAGGRTLTFYSHCNGGNSTPRNPPIYIIEVSSDGGATWTTIFDVLKDYPRDEQGNTVKATSYTKIMLDLSPYTSDQMKIRFNCYDTNNEGLQYWWQIDDLEISSDATSDVQAVRHQPAPTTVYDLQGRRVETLQKPGLYIMNGRKVLK